MAVTAAAIAAVLVAVAVVAHVRAGHRSTLLQSAAGHERHMQALVELGGQSVLWGAERQAYMNGFKAGEQTAEKNVMEDEEPQVSAAQLATLKKAIFSQGYSIRQAEMQHAIQISEKQAEEQHAMLTSEQQAETQHAMQISEKQAEEQRAMHISEKAANAARAHTQLEAREYEVKHAEVVHAMLMSEKAANYAREWKEAAEKQVEAEALRATHMNTAEEMGRKEAAAARLQKKHVSMEAGALAAPGSKRATELMDFCAEEFGDDQELRKFCYDKLISKPYGDSAILKKPVDPRQVLREQVVDAPTIQDAMLEAQKEGINTPPQYAELDNGELYRVLPLAQALKQHVAQKKAAARTPVHVDMHEDKDNGMMEVDAHTLAQSVAEAHDLGYKGSPEAVVYHPAHGKPVVYKQESEQQAQKQQAQQLAQVRRPMRGNKQSVEVDAPTLAGSIAKAHAMGLRGHPEAIVYHEADGKTELYEAQPNREVELAQRRAAVQRQRVEHQMMAEVKPTKQGEVEVEAKTLKQSLAEARQMGFKGEPTAIVYHPAHGATKTYVLEQPKK